jgi:hypothetical protein
MLETMHQYPPTTIHIVFSKMIRVIIAISFTVLTTSCLLKVTSPYYRPSADTGENVRAIKRQPRTDSVILFRHDGVIVGVNTLLKSKHHGFSESTLSVDISFEIPEGNEIRLVDKHVKVFAPLESWNSELLGRIWIAPGRTEIFPIEKMMIGKSDAVRFGTAQGYGNTKNATFFFSALILKGAELETFELELPGFVINDFEVNEPIISFNLNEEDVWVSVP